MLARGVSHAREGARQQTVDRHSSRDGQCAGDVRGNAGDGIHGASAGGTWQAVVFGFGGLRVTPQGWSTQPRLPKHWKRLSFRFIHRAQLAVVEITNPVASVQAAEPAS